MYNAQFVGTDSGVFVFDTTNNLVFDIEGLSGIDIDHTMSQGAGQIGETISVKSVGSKILTVSGVIFKNIADTKTQMRRVLAPLAEGRLIFNNEYYIDVSVKEAPTFSPLADRGNFTLRLLAPYPFFKKTAESNLNIGGITKAFQFPVNYSRPHIFATRSAALYANIYNGGDVESDFKLILSTNSISENPMISNLKTFETLKINRTLTQGESVSVYRDGGGILRVVLTNASGRQENIFSDLDEASNLFTLHPGDNLIARSDDAGGTNLIVNMTFNEPVVGVYDET